MKYATKYKISYEHNSMLQQQSKEKNREILENENWL